MKSVAARLFAFVAIVMLTLFPGVASGAKPVVTTLYSFIGGTDGRSPDFALVLGSDGNFYGTSYGSVIPNGSNFGTVFRMTPAGVFVTLHNFPSSGGDGETPNGLIAGGDGNFYGTTRFGGSGGKGTVFTISPSGLLTILHSFTGADGATPTAPLAPGGNGLFYGITSAGGDNGAGTVFKITAGGTLTTLHDFGADEKDLSATLIRGSDGNFYGTASGGEHPSYFGDIGADTVFEITPSGTLTILHTIDASLFYDFYSAMANALVEGSDGDFYGTTDEGGSGGEGNVFKITPSGDYTSLHDFTIADGPAALVQGSDGNFYGATESGGSDRMGSIFKITPAGVFSTLHSFTGTGTDGANADAALVQGSDGNFYGTTDSGGSHGEGTIFKVAIVPSPGVAQFTSATDSVTENMGGVTLTASRTDGSTGAISVGYATVDATAQAGTDYTSNQGTVSWADGETADKTINVPIINRKILDGSTKTFHVDLTSAVGGVTIGAISSVSVNILDSGTAPQPSVEISSPPDHSTVVSGTTVPFAAVVADPGGILGNVVLSINGTAVYRSTIGGSLLTEVPAGAPGAYTFTATVTDNQGRVSNATETVTVLASTIATPPTAGLITPVNNLNLAAGSTVTINLAAGSAATANLTQVDLYADSLLIAKFDGNGNLLPESASDQSIRLDAASTNPFQISYTLPGIDTLINLIAVAFDNLGQSTISSVVTIHSTVTSDVAPTVVLSGLADGAQVNVGAIYSLGVTLNRPKTSAAEVFHRGPITRDEPIQSLLARLDYFLNGLPFAELVNPQPPYTVAFTPPSSGSYTVDAVATDTTGLSTLSAPIVVRAVSPSVSIALVGDGMAQYGVKTGKAMVQRTGDTSATLMVYYSVKGSARSGVDYKAAKDVVVIPAGATQAKIKIKPLAVGAMTATRKARIRLLPSTNGTYTLGDSTVVKIKVIDK